MAMQSQLRVVEMCALTQLNRANYYRWLRRAAPASADMELRSELQRVCLEHRRYGYRRVTRDLRDAGIRVNHKRVLRLMKQDNLLVLRQRKFVLTTASGHALPVFSNYAAHLQIQGPDELWVADITYIRLRREFVYLAVVLDAWSRKVVGWSLARHLQASLCKTALERAIEARHPAPGLVHHSDRGVQYASGEYITVLECNRIQGSMSRPGNPWDNARCESFMKTLKQEEIYCGEYASLEDLEAHLANFIDGYYNVKRLHSSLGYRSPEAFERQRAAPAA
jgi:transposase InsO family protein